MKHVLAALALVGMAVGCDTSNYAFKVDKSAIVHVPVGKSSFEADALVANLAALVDAINRAKPSGAKGTYLRTLTIASTMGPGIRVDIPGVLAAASAAA